jgi:hypothetical protein
VGAILSVNLLQNTIGIDQAKALASILKEHPTLKSLCGNSGEETELDMSGKFIKAEGAIMLAPEIAGNGALTKLIFCGDEWFDGQQFATPEPATLEVGMAEADFSNKGLQVAGAIIVAAWMSHKDMGALTSLDLSSNSLTGEYGDDMSGNAELSAVIRYRNHT